MIALTPIRRRSCGIILNNPGAALLIGAAVALVIYACNGGFHHG